MQKSRRATQFNPGFHKTAVALQRNFKIKPTAILRLLDEGSLPLSGNERTESIIFRKETRDLDEKWQLESEWMNEYFIYTR